MSGLCKCAAMGLAIASLVGSVPSDARACSLVDSPMHEVVADSADVTPPAAPTVVLQGIERGSGGACSESSSCDDIGSVSLGVSATDDVSGAETIGFRVTVVEGELPAGALPP